MTLKALLLLYRAQNSPRTTLKTVYMLYADFIASCSSYGLVFWSKLKPLSLAMMKHAYLTI